MTNFKEFFYNSKARYGTSPRRLQYKNRNRVVSRRTKGKISLRDQCKDNGLRLVILDHPIIFLSSQQGLHTNRCGSQMMEFQGTISSTTSHLIQDIVVTFSTWETFEDSGHFLVRAKVRIRISTEKNVKPEAIPKAWKFL